VEKGIETSEHQYSNHEQRLWKVSIPECVIHVVLLIALRSLSWLDTFIPIPIRLIMGAFNRTIAISVCQTVSLT